MRLNNLGILFVLLISQLLPNRVDLCLALRFDLVDLVDLPVELLQHRLHLCFLCVDVRHLIRDAASLAAHFLGDIRHHSCVAIHIGLEVSDLSHQRAFKLLHIEGMLALSYVVHFVEVEEVFRLGDVEVVGEG